MAESNSAVYRARVVGRWVSVLAFIVGVFNIGAYSIAETLLRLGWRLGDATSDCFPWGQILSSVVLIGPEALGRATAGRIWVSLIDKIPGRTRTTVQIDSESGEMETEHTRHLPPVIDAPSDPGA